MQPQKTKKFLLRLIGYFVVAFLAVNLYNFWPVIYSRLLAQIFASDISVPENLQAVRPVMLLNVATPTQLLIPSLGINTKVLPVGTTTTGNLDVPNSLKNLGWYKYGPRPGEYGNAVIDGHQVDELGFGAVFKNLYLLKPGDDIFVQTANGENLNFQVVRVEVYKYNQAPLQDIFGESDMQNLNLITCDGNWIGNLKIKDKRLVVYTTLKL